MCQEHKDIKYLSRMQEHLTDALKHFNKDNFVGLFLQGSQNYNLDDEESDVDTKLIITPSLRDLVMARNPVSTTFVRDNDEHIDFKDVRLMLQTFRKQNLNFVEILFTDFWYMNPDYDEYWQMLVKNREKLARYNPFAALKAMYGVAMEKYHALEHRYPSRIPIIDKFGYDPKQLSHMLRVEAFMRDYIDEKPYAVCLKPENREELLAIKRGSLDHETARRVADECKKRIDDMHAWVEEHVDNYQYIDSDMEELLLTVQEGIMITSIKNELKERS